MSYYSSRNNDNSYQNGSGGGGYRQDSYYRGGNNDNSSPHYGSRGESSRGGGSSYNSSGRETYYESSSRGSSSRGSSRGDYRSNGGASHYSSNSNGGNPPPRNKWEAAAAAAESYNQSGGAYRSWETVDDEPEDYENEEWLQRKTKKVQDDSLQTTRKALQKLTMAEQTAQGSLVKLNQQSEQLYNIEHRLDVADQHVKVSEAKTRELHSLNRFFMLPNFAGKRTAKVEEKARLDMEEAERREAERKAKVQQVLDSRGENGYYGSYDDDTSSSSSKSKKKDKKDKNAPYDPWANRGPHYTTPDGLERDEKEVEIDKNLDDISGGLARLKMMGMTMQGEINSQNSHISRIDDKTSMVRDRVDGLNKNLDKISGKKKGFFGRK
ncbi:Protein transport protein S9 plasma membrane t-SNARE [Chytridiales sp. JEL 0842]|nr:Protein transport protein S9 plasma membrane t-SNARE [Chytridiales sp. JEL 0842]